MTISEFGTTEVVTATMNLPLYEEAFGGPISIGYYQEQDEVWIDHDGVRINVPSRWLDQFIKQLRRARQVAQEAKQ